MASVWSFVARVICLIPSSPSCELCCTLHRFLPEYTLLQVDEHVLWAAIPAVAPVCVLNETVDFVTHVLSIDSFRYVAYPSTPWTGLQTYQSSGACQVRLIIRVLFRGIYFH